ncbi:hypothetical protein LUZ60_006238 [Juncus effusus]|nr:hypothetical protein LUZ60_006238 [Juncus effusus]
MGESPLLTLFLAGFLILSSSPPVTFAQTDRLTSRSELLALYELRSSLGLRARDWPRAADPCLSWTGVSCESGRVTGLDIAGLKRTRLGRLMPQFKVDGLQELNRLTRFNASGFFLPGSIPDWFGARLPPSFSVLDLSGSGITGQIPESLGNLSKLTVLDLSLNHLKGPIPVSLGNLTEVKTLNLSHNGLSGSIPDPFWSLKSLSKLDLSGNVLIGELPTLSPSIGSSSTVLILSNNLYYGKIPLNFTTTFSRLASVDLSGNYFDGGAPIGSQSRGGSISISENCFLEASDQRSPADCVSFYSARGVPYDGPTSAAPAQQPSSKKSRKEMYILIAAIGGAGILLILFALITVLYCMCCRSGRRRRTSDPVLSRQQPRQNPIQSSQEPSSSPGGDRHVSTGGAHVSEAQSAVPAGGAQVNMTSVRRVANFAQVGDSYSYGRLRRATSDFSDANLIHRGHSGDLYRGQLDDGTRVAVKLMDQNVANKDAYLAAELELFAKGIHKRLVMLLGKCLDAPHGVKLLVYKLVENGDLGTVLHRKPCEKEGGEEEEEVHRKPCEKEEEEEVQSIDWIKRLKIATGVAESLCYLHHECEPPIVHRDVQASSILLDEKYDVKLCSLSESCVQEAENNNNNASGVISRFLKFSSASSEPSTSRAQPATCASDVYNLGVVLLELITGQSPPATSSAWLDRLLPSIDIYDKELITKVIDPRLILEEDHLEEVWAVAVVAKTCVNTRPNKRPTMRHVLKALEDPVKVVREDSRHGGKMRAASSRGSWNGSFWGSRRIEGEKEREAGGAELGGRSGSGGSNGERSFSIRRGSTEVVPEP